ncbi:MAG: glutathione S-transferase [Alphaproteobacteria bacterium]|nr:glutathione S-transferase [Alphaproteobacteria bacterium]
MVLPITSLYAGLLGALLVGLAALVSRQRLKGRPTDETSNDALNRAVRVHGNATEYVPIALILLGLLEANGAPADWLHVLGGGLFLARIGHAWGLSRHSGRSPGRFVGTVVTWSAILFAALWLIQLAWP